MNLVMKASDILNVIIKWWSVNPRINFLLESAPGAAKTESVRHLATHLLPAVTGRKVMFIILHPQVKTREDFAGYPSLLGGVAQHLAFDDLKTLTEVPSDVWCIVLIDDVGNSLDDVQGALGQVIQERTINGISIPDNVSFILCTNRRKDRTAVKGIIAMLRSRCVPLQWKMDAETFAQYISRTHPASAVPNFIRLAGKWIEEDQVSVDLDASVSSCRTIEKVAEIETLPLPEATKAVLYASTAGAAFAADFASYLANLNDMPSDLIPTIEATGAYPSEEVLSNPPLMYAVTGALARRANLKTLGNIDKWYQSLSRREWRRLFWQEVQDANPGMVETKEYESFATRSQVNN